jgi:hypothetical protein
LRGPCRISVSRLARVAATKEVHIQFQNLEMKTEGVLFYAPKALRKLVQGWLDAP